MPPDLDALYQDLEPFLFIAVGCAVVMAWWLWHHGGSRKES